MCGRDVLLGCNHSKCESLTKHEESNKTANQGPSCSLRGASGQRERSRGASGRERGPEEPRAEREVQRSLGQRERSRGASGQRERSRGASGRERGPGEPRGRERGPGEPQGREREVQGSIGQGERSRGASGQRERSRGASRPLLLSSSLSQSSAPWRATAEDVSHSVCCGYPRHIRHQANAIFTLHSFNTFMLSICAILC
ncbi:unnamed protein product [Boreogadus saida]